MDCFIRRIKMTMIMMGSCIRSFRACVCVCVTNFRMPKWNVTKREGYDDLKMNYIWNDYLELRMVWFGLICVWYRNLSISVSWTQTWTQNENDTHTHTIKIANFHKTTFSAINSASTTSDHLNPIYIQICFWFFSCIKYCIMLTDVAKNEPTSHKPIITSTVASKTAT